MSNRSPSLLLEDILLSSKKIISYTQNLNIKEFMEDEKTIDAVIRNFEIIGEAANRLPENFREINPEINWHALRGLRNRIAHDYMGIDYSIIWELRRNYLPELISIIEKIKI
jgi:uncharacterized protein with HEPN domain